MRALTFISAAAISLAVLGGPLAQPAPGQVTVRIGPNLQAEAGDYGPDQVEQLRHELGDDIYRALAKDPGRAPVEVDLVLEDAAPTQPTPAQMGLHPGLSPNSVGLGGARISGSVVTPDGVRRPLRFSWYESELQNHGATSTWSDAEQAFEMLAGDLAHGRIPDHYARNDPFPRQANNFGARYPGRPWP